MLTVFVLILDNCDNKGEKESSKSNNTSNIASNKNSTFEYTTHIGTNDEIDKLSTYWLHSFKYKFIYFEYPCTKYCNKISGMSAY